MNKFGYVRLTCDSPKVHVANPEANAEEMAGVLKSVTSDIVLFPELSLTVATGACLATPNLICD